MCSNYEVTKIQVTKFIIFKLIRIRLVDTKIPKKTVYYIFVS